MKETVKQRIKAFCAYRHITIMKFEELSNLSNGYVSAIRKSIGVEKLEGILRAFPELSREWLLYGEGEMLKPQQSIVQQNVNGNKNLVVGNNYGTCAQCGSDIPTLEGEEVQGAPIIPTTLARAGTIDILERLERHPDIYERSTVVVGDMPIDLWFRVRDDSMSPDYHCGDLLGLGSFPEGHINPRPGKKYAVNTKSNGLFPCTLYPAEGGYRAHASQDAEFPDFFIALDDIITIYRILIMVRI